MAEGEDNLASVLNIEGEMTIYRAAELKRDLLAVLTRSALLELNLSQVTELDTAGIQILMMLKTQARETGRTLKLVGHSQAVLDVFELLNLAAYFGDPLLIGVPQYGT